MKKIALGLILVFALAGMSLAEIGIGVPTLLGPTLLNAGGTQPTLVVGVGALDLVLGYSSVAQGTGANALKAMLFGGAYYLLKKGPVSAGPSLFYYSIGTNANNTRTNIMAGISAKAPLTTGVDLRSDVVLYNVVGGKTAGVEIKDVNQILSIAQLYVVINVF